MSNSVTQLVHLFISADIKKGEKVPKDKCSTDHSLQKEKPDDDREGRKAGAGKQLALSKVINLKESSDANQRSDKGGNSEKVRENKQAEEMSVLQTTRALIDESEKRYKGKETTLFYKSPSLQLIDEAVARKIHEKENPSIDIEAIKQEEERLAAEKMKVSKSKSRKEKSISDPI